MGITDKITGRAKQAAGDLTGSKALRREGVEEERKADAKEELAREEMRAEQERERAERTQARADAKADEVAARERRT